MELSKLNLKTNRKPLKLLSVPFVFGISIFTFFFNGNPKQDVTVTSSLNIPSPDNVIGINYNLYKIFQDTVQDGYNYSDILAKYDVPYHKVLSSVQASKDIYDIERNLVKDKPYHILKHKYTEEVDAMVYETSVLEYVVFHLGDSIYTERIMKPIDTVISTASGRIESSLWNAIMTNDMGDNHTANLAVMMEDAFAWTVDFHHLQKEDEFKLVFEKLYVQGELVALGRLQSAYFQASGEEFYAIKYKSSKHDGFFDLNGKTMKRGFLKAPVKYSRISSRYQPRRFHPVLKRYKAHLGTDFAAPHGTPIVATADGVITRRGRSKGNGNYVKIKHDDTYSTQYLHMSKFASGQQVGSHVRQGQVIGYVGSTGYATGPHVCYRFWKNGRQIDALKMNFPAPEPLPKEELPDYFRVRDHHKNLLDNIELPSLQKITEEQNIDESKKDLGENSQLPS